MTQQVDTLGATRVGGFGQSSAVDAAAAGRESVRMALADNVPAPGDLVILFPNAAYDLEALHAAAVEAAGPAQVVGCTTVGAFTAEEQVPQGCVAAFIPADGISFGVRHVE